MSWADWQWYRRVLEFKGIKMPTLQGGQSAQDEPTTDLSGLDALFGVVADDIKPEASV